MLKPSPSLVNYEEIQPYTDKEVPAALDRLMHEPVTFQLCQYLYPGKSNEELIRLARKTQTVRQLQVNFSYPAIRGIIERTTAGFSHSGFEQMKPEDGGYLFISNHRDIVLDSAILNVLLVDHELETAETGAGENLFLSPVITDLLKINRNFVVHRPEQPRELYQVSKHLSAYILDRRESNTSIWIAQRSGRTKDGLDRTETGLLKMLGMAGRNFVEHFLALNIRPMAISYEYDPCDRLKVQELYFKNERPDLPRRRKDDFKAMLSGVTDQKGRTHFAMMPSIGESELLELEAVRDRNERYREFRALLDRRIVEGYRLFPVHYIAADWQRGEERYASHYSEAEVAAFKALVQHKLEGLEGDPEVLQRMMLDIYAGPVKSKEEFGLL
jgi:hypothetical protein